jgi:hypothetical protein
MNYQQAFAEHYKAVRARIANAKPMPVQLPSSGPSEPEPSKAAPRSSDPRMKILYECAEENGCTIEDMLGPSRCKNFVKARWEAIWRLHQRKTMSMAQIGQYLNKDHSTVINAIRKYEKSLAQGEAK